MGCCLGHKKCDLIHQDVELREQRVYPTAHFLSDFGRAYQVHAYACTAGVDCNLAGISCKWALNAPDTDQLTDLVPPTFLSSSHLLSSISKVRRTETGGADTSAAGI